MTLTTPTHLDVRTDGHVDRHVDDRKDSQPVTNAESASAFVIVLANHKGGVTKTTSTANLGACLAEAGHRVLLVDCDPQANLSEAFGWTEDLPGERLEDLLAHPAAAGRYAPPPALQADVAPQLPWRDRLRILPCTDALADVSADLPASAGDGWESRLKEILEPLRARFDFVLLDTPPGLGNLSGMAVLAADGLLIPARPADLDVRGAGKLYDLVEAERPRPADPRRPDRRQRPALANRPRREQPHDRRSDARAAHPDPPCRAGRVSTPVSRADSGARARLDGQPRLPPTRSSPPRGARTMSAPEPMPSVRRRPIPGMTSQPATPAPAPPRAPERPAADEGAPNDVASGIDGSAVAGSGRPFGDRPEGPAIG